MMKKWTSILLCAILAMALLPGGSALAVDGVFEGSATGYGGRLALEVTLENDAITKIKITQESETIDIGTLAVDDLPGMIIEAQSLQVDAIGGATFTSEAILLAVAHALENAGLDPSTWGSGGAAEEPAGEAAAPGEMETDFLIIGGGIAGMTAAIEASDVGFESITVLEQLSHLGGAAFVSEGILSGYDTQVSEAMDLHVDPLAIYEEQMREKKYLLDPALTMLTVEQSGVIIDWLIDELGVVFQDEIITKDGYGTLPIVHLVEGEGPGLRAPYEAALAARPNIEVMMETRGVELIVEDGAVVGAVAMQGEQELRIRAKAVLIATGGYNSNHELIVATHPANRVFQTSLMPGNNGDGLIMATAIGAGTQNLDQLQCYLRDYALPTSSMPYLFKIFVGQEGNRFMDEKRTGQIWNQENRDAVIMQTGKDGLDYFFAINDHATMEAYGMLEGIAEHPGVAIGETLEELAANAGIDAEGLKATVDAWNAACAAGEDAEFGRDRQLEPIGDGPYYAVQTTLFTSVCHGGLIKNAEAEVLRFDGSAIQGLYAAGEVTTVTNSNGFTISNAIIFARIAAQSAYNYAK